MARLDLREKVRVKTEVAEKGQKAILQKAQEELGEGVIKNLCVHHIESYYRCAEKRLDVNNGLTLCASCHAKLHNPKGVKKRGVLSELKITGAAKL